MSTVWELVAAQAERTPAAVAVRGEKDRTYRELIEQAAGLSTLISRRDPRGGLVAMQVLRPASAACVHLAAARSGRPVLPLNATSPPAHRAHVLADARPSVLVRDQPDGGFTVEDTGQGPDASLPDGLAGAAYVIYTSGSTGRPKGVAIRHEGLISRLRALARVPGFGPGDSLLAMAAPSFDMSIPEILLPLTVGGSVTAAPAEAAIDPEVFAETVATHRPTVIQATPSFWRLTLAWGWQGDPGVRSWCGGEALTAHLADRLVDHCGQLWNLYGPTEATVWASAARVLPGAPLHLGAPLPGAGMYLADEHAEPVTEEGAAGEIMLYGDGLAIGYLHRPELTAQRFRVCRTPDGPRRCYATGDRARLRADGTLEFLGRTDGQVKVRGHRVELGEVESVAEEQPGVTEAAAVLCEADDPQRSHIALFVVADDAVGLPDIRRWMAQRLPPSMCPGRIVLRESLPRTTAGKVDRVLLASD